MSSKHCYSGSLRGRALRSAVLGFAVCAMCWPAWAAPVARTGVVSAKLTITFTQAPPAGSSVSCAVTLIGSDVNAPTDSKFISVPVSGSSAACNIAVHYKWLIANASSNMTIAYSVSGPSQSSSGIADVITMPGSGKITNEVIAITQ